MKQSSHNVNCEIEAGHTSVCYTILSVLSVHLKILIITDFSSGPMVKNSLCNAGDASLIPAWETKLPHPWGN